MDRLTLRGGASFDTLASPIRAGGAAAPAPCPPLGADTREILSAIGFTDREIESLEADGAI